MASGKGRRLVLQLCSAAQSRRPTASGRGVTKRCENFLAIQIKPYEWMDEGIDQVLDNVQQKGNVSTVRAYIAEGRMTRDGAIPLPDHGKPGAAEFVGGAF